VAGCPAAATSRIPAAAQADSAYVTIMFGRTIFAPSCAPRAGMRTLFQTADDLRSLGLSAVGGVVVDRIGETERRCVNGVTYPTWADLTRLRSAYRWTFVSQGMTYSDMTAFTTDDERFQESAATLPVLAERGHRQAWGLFNYPNDKQDAASQAIVTEYFSFGRLYTRTPAVNPRSALTTYPYQLVTLDTLGGQCNNPDLPCYDFPVRSDRRTTPLPEVVKVLRPKPGEYGVVQFYRLVSGKSGTMGQPGAWDCTSPDWRNRWTGQPENYCRNTFLSALRMRNKAAVVTTPDAVAMAWGRGNPGLRDGR